MAYTDLEHTEIEIQGGIAVEWGSECKAFFFG